MSRQLLFSLTKKDFKVQYYCASGPGGQHRNKVATAARVTHIESGAVGNCKSYKSQARNKKTAFTRLIESEEFKKWHKIKAARMMGIIKTPAQLEQEVRDWMRPEFLKEETF